MFGVVYIATVIVIHLVVFGVLRSKLKKQPESQLFSEERSPEQILLLLKEQFPDQEFPSHIVNRIAKNDKGGFFDLHSSDDKTYYRYFLNPDQAHSTHVRADITDLKNSVLKTQADLNMLLDMQSHSGIGYWRYYVKSDILYWSDEVFRIYDLEPGTFITRERAIDFLHPDHHSELGALFEQADNRNQGWDREMRIVTMIGREKRIRTSGIPVKRGGELVELRGLIIEIDQEVTKRSKMNQVEDSCNFLLENAGDLLCIHSLDGCIRKVSPSVEKLTGYQQAEVLGKPIYDFIHEEDRFRVKKTYQQALLKGDLNDLVLIYRLKKKNGDYRNFRTKINPIQGVHTKDLALLSCSIDITDCM